MKNADGLATHAVRMAVSKGVGGVVGKTVGMAAGSVTKASLRRPARELKTRAKDMDLTVGHARFALEVQGQPIGSIHAESTSAWGFSIRDLDGHEIAQITKTWAGWAKERFTKADNYILQIHYELSEPLRSLVVATTVAVDVALKQGNPSSKNRGRPGGRSYQ